MENPSSYQTRGDDPYYTVVRDFNGDSRLDIAVAIRVPRHISVFLLVSMEVLNDAITLTSAKGFGDGSF